MCDGHFPFITFWSNMIRLLETIGLIAGVSLGGGVVESAAVVLIIKSIGTFLLCMALKKRIQWLRLGFSSASLKECRRLLKPAITYMAFPLGNALSMQGFVFVIGMMLNSSAVVVFNTLRTLTRVTSQVMTTIHMSVRPEISFAYGSANFELAKNLHRRAAQWSIYSAVLIFIVLNFIGGYVYQFWLSGKVVFDANLFMWLLISAAVNTVWYTSSAVLMATNTHQGIALAYLFETTISLALAVILINEYNIIGAGMATIFGDIFMTIIVLRHSFKLLQDNLVDFMQEVLFKPSLLLIDVKKILGNRFKRKYI
jgi:O-antigen/teichoic acid export membrane protein